MRTSSSASMRSRSALRLAIAVRWLSAMGPWRACLSRVFSMAIISTSWRRRVASALTASCCALGGDLRLSLMAIAKRAMRAASSLSVLARRPSASRKAFDAPGIDEGDGKAAADQGLHEVGGVGADRLQHDVAD